MKEKDGKKRESEVKEYEKEGTGECKLKNHYKEEGEKEPVRMNPMDL